jgi:hypothetical protein
MSGASLSHDEDYSTTFYIHRLVIMILLFFNSSFYAHFSQSSPKVTCRTFPFIIFYEIFSLSLGVKTDKNISAFQSHSSVCDD